MKMSTQYTVSVQILLLTAMAGGKRITSEIMAQSTGANPVMIRQLFGKLKDAGILNVACGRGITTLAREASDISLWDIYMAVEEDSTDTMFKFHPKISNGCQIGRFFKDVLSVHLDDAMKAMGESMSKVSLAQLIDEWQSMNSI